jgi:hypothetical protein
MSLKFETLGNATILLFEDERPVLATDPWLTGKCYFGSWALDHPLTTEQISAAANADYIWISHGHPDHLHDPSLDLLPPGKKILLPDHYHPEIKQHLESKGFNVAVLGYRRWVRLSDNIEVLCLDNLNQDGILVIRAGDFLLVNLNDSPLCGEGGFLRRLSKSFPKENVFVFALCSIDADMFNFVDDNGRSLAPPAMERKPRMIAAVARRAERLGAGNFCCSSSQHVYARADSVWANPYRITWEDMRQFWPRPRVRLIEPFVTYGLSSGELQPNYSVHQTDPAQIAGGTGEDDWTARLSAAEWSQVETFMRKFELVRRYLDFVQFTVAGESRRFAIKDAASRRASRQRGIEFIVPKQSLMTVVQYGFFDDLLIGNFMRVRLVNTRLYPRFTPLVAKVGGNAKVYTRSAYRRFLWRYLRRNPWGTLLYLCETEARYVLMPLIRTLAQRLGMKKPLNWVYRRLILGESASPGHA